MDCDAVMALPRKMGVLLEKFDVPVEIIETFGRNPLLYNELRIRRDQKVRAEIREDIHTMTVKELRDCIGDKEAHDFPVPWGKTVSVARTRPAAEKCTSSAGPESFLL